MIAVTIGVERAPLIPGRQSDADGSRCQADQFKEHELLHDFLTEIFCGLLGYTRVVNSSERYRSP
ncbi:MAG TPA: hypothetical protein VKI17_05040 [Gemmataceae bacterium]|nr:hypothetical protein [Gemmataceae bacterium]